MRRAFLLWAAALPLPSPAQIPEPVLPAWTLAANPRSITVRLHSTTTAEFPLTRSDGSALKLKADGNQLVLELAASPQYVTLGKAALQR
jgi:hypothetical protein